MSQFSTYDNSSDRKEIQVLFQRMAEELPEAESNKIRARWLQQLITRSTNYTVAVNPEQCHPVGAYCLFIQIVGVLGVKIGDAAIQLSKYVAKRKWHET